MPIRHVLTWLGESQAGHSQVVQLSNTARGEYEELGVCRFTLCARGALANINVPLYRCAHVRM